MGDIVLGVTFRVASPLTVERLLIQLGLPVMAFISSTYTGSLP